RVLDIHDGFRQVGVYALPLHTGGSRLSIGSGRSPEAGPRAATGDTDHAAPGFKGGVRHGFGWCGSVASASGIMGGVVHIPGGRNRTGSLAATKGSAPSIKAAF